MGLNIDAEEADRLDLSLDVIEAVLSDPEGAAALKEAAWRELDPTMWVWSPA